MSILLQDPCNWPIKERPGRNATFYRPGGNRGYCRCCNGFTLIETLVAMSILAISLVVILQLFSGGLRSGRLSDEYTRSIFHAREKMEEILLSKELTEGVFEGEFGDTFRWKAEIFINETPEEGEVQATKPPIDIFNIKVGVAWNSGEKERHFEISTMKIAERFEIKS